MHKKIVLAITLMAGYGMHANADTTLSFTLTTPDGKQSEQQFEISGRFIRMDDDSKAKSRYKIIDTGHQLVITVDDANKTFRVTHAGYLYWPKTTKSLHFRPTRKMKHVAGHACRVVMELGKTKMKAEHCMSNSGQLGLNNREMISISRLFSFARRLDWGWPGATTKDERMISISSKDLTGEARFKLQELKSVSHEVFDRSRLQVPRSYKRQSPDLPAPPTPERH